MVSKNTKIVNKEGFHMRPANYFIKEMTPFKSNIYIIFGDAKINGKSIMNIMASCIKYGSEITIECDGEDENEMLEKAIEIIESGLGDEI